MRVMHIIPAAFDYFKDIEKEAFALADEIERLEIAAEPVKSDTITLQYGAPTRAEKSMVAASAPGREYQGQFPTVEIVNQFADYDIVHLHTPFLGNAKILMKWKKENPGQPFVITYYRDVLLPDLFAHILKWYNAYYLPKLFNLADTVVCFSLEDFNKSLGSKYLQDKDRLISLEEIEEERDEMDLTEDGDHVKLDKRKVAATKLLQIYNFLLQV